MEHMPILFNTTNNERIFMDPKMCLNLINKSSYLVQFREHHSMINSNLIYKSHWIQLKVSLFHLISAVLHGLLGPFNLYLLFQCYWNLSLACDSTRAIPSWMRYLCFSASFHKGYFSKNCYRAWFLVLQDWVGGTIIYHPLYCCLIFFEMWASHPFSTIEKVDGDWIFSIVSKRWILSWMSSNVAANE